MFESFCKKENRKLIFSSTSRVACFFSFSFLPATAQPARALPLSRPSTPPPSSLPTADRWVPPVGVFPSSAPTRTQTRVRLLHATRRRNRPGPARRGDLGTPINSAVVPPGASTLAAASVLTNPNPSFAPAPLPPHQELCSTTAQLFRCLPAAFQLSWSFAPR